MVPITMATLAVVAASQIGVVASDLGAITPVIPLFAAYLVIMPWVGAAVSRLFRQDVPRSRALIFSGSTRNSLVVLPLALALPDPLALAAVVVVTQTLVELVGMVLLVRVAPHLARLPAAP